MTQLNHYLQSPVYDSDLPWEETVYYMHIQTYEIMPEQDWERDFRKLNNPCKWYGCNGEECHEHGHPEYFDPSECFLVEVESLGVDEDGSIIWERV